MKVANFIVLAVISALVVPVSVAAKEIERQQIGQFAATDRAPRTRTECIDRENVVMAGGEKKQMCTECRTEAQIYYRRSYMVMEGPSKTEKAERKGAVACARQAAVLAQTDRADEGTAQLLPAARVAFSQCLNRAKVSGSADFTLAIDERADWTGWQ